MGAATVIVICLVCFPDESSRKAVDRPGVGAGFELSAPVQHREERYDQIPFQGNIDSFLKQLLRNAAVDDEVADLFEQLRDNPALTNLNADQLRDWMAKARDPWLRYELAELARKHKSGKWTAVALRAKLLEIQETLGKVGVPGGKAASSGASFVPRPEPPADDKLARWAKDWLKDVDNTRAGDFLRDSPAWKNGLRDLDKLAKASDVRFDWLKRMPDGLKLPNGWTGRLGDWAARLPRLSNLPRWRFSAPNLGRLNVNPGGGGGGFGAPSLGAAGFSDNLFWLLVPLLLALLGWFFYRNLGRAPALAATARRRGPWPVDPATVATRTQLIRAFDYLALLLLGDQVRTWNHVAVAKKLGEEAARNPAAGALAHLYELARYTPGDDTLPPQARDAARRHLVYLARSAAA